MVIRQIAKRKTEKESKTSTIDEILTESAKIDELSNDEEYVKSQDLTNEEKKFSEKLGEENIQSKDIPEFFLDKEKESKEEK